MISCFVFSLIIVLILLDFVFVLAGAIDTLL